MKKILAIAIVVVMTVALCLSTYAVDVLEPEGVTSGDQILAVSDNHDLAKLGGNDVNGTDLGAITEENFYIWGWHASVQKIVEYGYRYGDVVILGSAKFYHDNNDPNGKADNDTIAIQHNNLTDGADGESVRFKINVPVLKGTQEVYAVVKLADGTVHDMWKVTYTAENGKSIDDIKPAQQGGNDNPGTADAAVIAIAAVACIALAGVVVAKKVK